MIQDMYKRECYGAEFTCTGKIRNEHIRRTTRVSQDSKNITEIRLNCYGHRMRSDEGHIVRKVLRTEIPWQKEERTTGNKME